jgi:hypothetical protein
LGWDHHANGYAAGELVAEMSACILAAELGIPSGESLENHAAYLRSWLTAMKADSSFIFKASTQASKVTDYLLTFLPTTEVISEPKLVKAKEPKPTPELMLLFEVLLAGNEVATLEDAEMTVNDFSLDETDHQRYCRLAQLMEITDDRYSSRRVNRAIGSLSRLIAKHGPITLLTDFAKPAPCPAGVA